VICRLVFFLTNGNNEDVYLDSCIADFCGDTRRNVTLSELKKLNVIYFWMQGVLMTVVCVVGKYNEILYM